MLKTRRIVGQTLLPVVNVSPDNISGVMTFDKSTGAQNIIDHAHHEIHEGDHYYIEGNATLGNAATLFIKLVTPDTARWGHFIWELNSSGILTATLDEDAVGGMADGSRPTIHANNRNMNCWTGLHDGGDDKSALVDSSQSWTVDELVGFQVFNSTDGSSGFITANTSDTVTATLAGGTGNDWDDDDTYEINQTGFVITSGVTTCTSFTQRVSNQKFGVKNVGGAASREDELVMKRNTTYCRSFTSGTASNIVGFKALWYEHTNRE